jgi:hypothetical protein
LHVNNLIKRGHLRKRDHSARSLEVTDPGEEPKVTSNTIKPGEEKWLIEKIEHFFADAENTGDVSQEQVDQLYVLVGALRVLGLEGAAQSFVALLSELIKRLATA